ncbi:MAG: cysteine desulfurase family protein [bacterium]
MTNITDKKRIYLDHAATTPVDPRVLKAMLPYMSEKYGNASSQHSFGQDAMKGVNKAKKQIAEFLNCSMEEVIFTSGATESNNLAIMGYARAVFNATAINHSLSRSLPPHIITSQIEHPAIFAPCQALEREGVEVTYVGVNRDGLVNVEEIKNAIKETTVLVSIMYVNNETGVIQPIREIGKMIEKHNKKIVKTRHCIVSTGSKIIFHTDATQAVNYCNCDTKHLHVDMLSLSGHKIYGPKGIGALYIKNGIYLEPIMYGGHQENGVRSGTYNIHGIAGLGKAIEIISKTKSHKKISKLRDKIIKQITKKLPDVYINGSMENRIPSNINISFKGVDGESLMIMLDMAGIAVSTGSACASGSHNPSHVLTAMGVSPRLVEGSIRITLGKNNTEKEVDYFIDKLTDIINKLRKVSGKK